jgi:hypothetical protein
MEDLKRLNVDYFGYHFIDAVQCPNCVKGNQIVGVQDFCTASKCSHINIIRSHSLAAQKQLQMHESHALLPKGGFVWGAKLPALHLILQNHIFDGRANDFTVK